MGGATSALERLIERIVEARESGTALDIHGGGTKRFYGNPPRGEPLDTRALAGITSYEPTELVITALAGTPLTEVQEALAACGQVLAFEPPQFGPGGTLGGMVAAAIAGPARACAGPVRDYVLGLTLLNGMGEPMTFGGQVMKNVAGYDVSRAITGSMGILGVICEVSLKVMPAAPASETRHLDIDEAGALRLLSRWAREGLAVTASSWYEGRLHVRLAGSTAAVGRCRQHVGGQEMAPGEAARWWSELRDHRHEWLAPTPSELAQGECLWRLSVPDTAPPMALPGRALIEWGGGQRWYRSTGPAAAIRAAASAVGGHATLLRAADKSPGAFAQPLPSVMEVHRRLKDSFDPHRIFNPGRLYPEL